MTPEVARQMALNLLARRDHCRAELTLKLIREGAERGAAAAVVKALMDEKMVDDVRFVENHVAYQAEQGQGPVRIGHKLRSPTLELDPELIERCLSTGQDWVA